jgi:aspartate aminotransferase
MKADGVDVVGFGAGEPDFNTPDNIKIAAMQAITGNMTRYTPAVGTLDLRKAVCARLKADFDLDYEPSQISVSSGAKPCVFTALQAIINPGDEVILPSPFWVSYAELIRMAGGIPVIVETTEAEDFKISAERLASFVNEKTKCLILNNPCNPTGMMYTREELEGIAKVCVEQDIYVISDEIYCCLVYDKQQFTSFASLGEEVKERTIVINGVSKAYAMTGWRIGYAASPAPIAKVIANYLSHALSNPCSVSQYAAQVALSDPQDTVKTMRRAFERRRNFMVDRMNQIEGVSCIKPQGAFYVMMNIEKLIGKEMHGVVIKDAADFAKLFLEYGKVAVVPGTAFNAPNFVRWSYATSTDNIRKGLDRLERFLKGEVIE